MKLLSPIDVTVLTWLKPELDSTLQSARSALERFVEEGQGITALRECSGHLHQVAGILSMVELTGAARLAEEMEQLSLALADGVMPNADNAFSLLMQCIVQLPDYLERLQNGNRDVPVVLLPLVNELRSIRGESMLGEEAVYSAPTQQPLPDEVLAYIRSQAGDASFGATSLQFQAHLQGWLNNADDSEATRKFAVVCSQVGGQCREESSRKLFWVASALLTALAEGSIALDSALKQSLVRVDQEVNFLNHRGIGEIRSQSPVRLTQELLYFVARDSGASPALKQVYEVFELAKIIPDEEEIAHAKSSLLGRNNALLESVAAVIKEDILRVKDALDLSIRSDDKNPADMADLVVVLARIENTLGLIDAEDAREHIRGNRETIQAYIDGSSQLNDSELMAIAKSLLSVELMLDYHGSETVGRQSRLASDFMASSQSHQLLDALIRESIVNFMQVRQAYVAFVESYWDHQQLSVIPGLLKQVSGALAILEYTPVSAYIDAVNAYTRAELIDAKGVPNGDQMERLAEVLASLEYYLESVRDRRPSRDRILEITRKSLEALHYWPVPEKAARAAERDMPATEPTPVVAPAAPEFSAQEVLEAAVALPDEGQAIVVDESGDVVEGFDYGAEGIDDEIREIFLEEFNEENANLAVFFKDWQTDPENIELIRPIRRVFHTLKGSGRLVGARPLSEFSWKVESLLNRVLDGSRPVSDPVVSMIKLAIATLPSFHKALTGEHVSLDLSGLNDVAERLASGEEIYYRGRRAAEAIAPDAPDTEATVATMATLSADAVANEVSVIDPVLLEILKPEVSGHLQTVNEWLQRAAASGHAEYEDALFRAIHTMNGAFAMSEVSTMAGILAPAEALVRRGIAHKAAANAETVACLAQVADAVQATLDDLSQNAPPSRYSELESWVAAKRDELPDLPSMSPTPIALADMAAEQAAAEQAAAEQAAAEQAAAEQAAAEQAAAEQAAAEQAAAEQAAAEQAAAEQAAAEQAAAEQAAAEHAAAEQAAAEQAAAEHAAAEHAAAEQAAAEQAAAEHAAAEQAAAEQSAAEQAAAEHAAAEQAAAEQAAAEHAAAEQAAAEQAAAEQAAAEQAAAEQAAAEQAAAEQAAAEQAAAEQAAAEQAAAEQAAAEQAAAEHAAAEQAAAEQAAAEQAAAEQAAAEQAAAEQAAAEQAAAEKAEADAYGMSLEELERLTDPNYVADATPSAVEPDALSESTNETPEAVIETTSAPLMDTTADNAVDSGRDGPTERLDTRELDEELLDIFTEEAKDLLDQSDNLLVQLKQSEDGIEPLLGLQRNLHTLKGGARMAGLFSIGELSHSLESFIQASADQGVVPNLAQLGVIEKSLDALHRMADQVEERAAPESPSALIQLLDAGGEVAPAAAALVAEAPSAKVAKPLSGPIDLQDLDTDEGLRTPQDVVRIRADLLDQLVNFAGEVAIYRARLEQQLGQFKTNLVELDQTTSRLREQLRRLDIETEAQIAARNIREADQGNKDFDPLELDRFTTQQQLSRSLAESSNDLINLQATLDDLTRHHETLLLQQSRVSSELQEGLMRTRMVPFETLLPRLRRVMRQAAEDSGKRVELRVEGAHGEMDRSVLDRMTAPLEHLLRNAVAHGIESPAQRQASGKSETGNVIINVAQEGTEVVLSVRDDGHGLDIAQIRSKALQKGLIGSDDELSEAQILALITQTGFSTVDTVTRLAGRGIGMDVVSSEIRNLNGSLGIQSTLGRGTEFLIRLPLNLAVTKAVFVKIGESQFAIPIASVDGVGRIGRDELDEKLRLESPEFNYAGNRHKIYDLGTLLDLPTAKAAGSMQMPMLLSKSGQDRIAICVDQVLGSQEIVVKPVGPQVTSVPGVYGASIMPDGGVVVILDLAPLVRHNAERQIPQTAETVEDTSRSMPLVMVVDDSITMRKVTSRILERNNYEVVVARDGLEAIEKMAEQVPDLVLLDIEMPRMDGYEVAQNMKSDSRLQHVPIMMITSRTGEKHRQRAFDLGVERYLGKPYQEFELMRQVNEIFKK